MGQVNSKLRERNKASIEDKHIQSRKDEMRVLFKKCFKNDLISLVPFEVWRDLIVPNADAKTLLLLSQTCWGFKEIFDDFGENNLHLALVLRKENQIRLARKYLQKCAENNDSLAMLHIARAYGSFGWGLKFDEGKAMEWRDKAAKNGNAVAMTRTANVLPENEQKNLWAKVLESNDKYAIGLCLIYGFGTNRDEKRAIDLMESSANEGNEFSQLLLGNLYISQNVEKSFYYYSKAAEQGNASAQYKLGEMYAEGQGCEKSEELSQKWLKRAKNQGFISDDVHPF